VTVLLWETMPVDDVQPFDLIRVCTLDGCSRIRRVYHSEPCGAGEFVSVLWFGWNDGTPVRGECVLRAGDRVEVAR